MNADKHTPGPWSEVTYEGDSYATIIGPDGDECIAILDGNIPSKAEQEANARLIVRAVNSHEALVAALRGAENWITEYHASMGYAADSGVDGLLSQLRAALALAEQGGG